MTLLDLRSHDTRVTVAFTGRLWTVALSVDQVLLYYRADERPRFREARDAAFAAEQVLLIAQSPRLYGMQRARDLLTCLAVGEQRWRPT